MEGPWQYLGEPEIAPTGFHGDFSTSVVIVRLADTASVPYPVLQHHAPSRILHFRSWKVELQKLADETGLALHVHHYPPGTSKWNKIEHRLFCHVTQDWRGRPLESRLAVVELIGATTTRTGLKVECVLDTRTYEKGLKVSDEEMASPDIIGDTFHPEWNYTIRPRKS